MKKTMKEVVYEIDGLTIKLENDIGVEKAQTVATVVSGNLYRKYFFPSALSTIIGTNGSDLKKYISVDSEHSRGGYLKQESRLVIDAETSFRVLKERAIQRFNALHESSKTLERRNLVIETVNTLKNLTDDPERFLAVVKRQYAIFNDTRSVENFSNEQSDFINSLPKKTMHMPDDSFINPRLFQALKAAIINSPDVSKDNAVSRLTENDFNSSTSESLYEGKDDVWVVPERNNTIIEIAMRRSALEHDVWATKPKAYDPETDRELNEPDFGE